MLIVVICGLLLNSFYAQLISKLKKYLPGWSSAGKVAILRENSKFQNSLTLIRTPDCGERKVQVEH